MADEPDDSLVGFIYLLLRDHVQPGDLEQVLRKDLELPLGETPNDLKTFVLTNPYLEGYAKEVVRRLRIKRIPRTEGE